MSTKPRKATTLIVALLVASCLLIIDAQAAARAQEQQAPAAAVAAAERERGVELYKSGDIKGAVKALRAAVKRDEDDGEAWYYLSLALNRDGDTKGARKAVERAVKLRPTFAPARAGLAYFLLISNKLADALREAETALASDAGDPEANYVAGLVHMRRDAPAKALEHVEAALKTKPEFAGALLLKSQALLGVYAERASRGTNQSQAASPQRTEEATVLLKQAAESLEQYFRLNPSPPNADVWREQLASLRLYARNVKEGAAGPDQTVFSTKEVTTKARILSRPEPQYPEAARNAQVRGTVVLRGVFAADGTVQNILVIHSLPHGLTEECVRAARKIKFIPATKDGRPVSQFIQIEYNFSLY